MAKFFKGGTAIAIQEKLFFLFASFKNIFLMRFNEDGTFFLYF